MILSVDSLTKSFGERILFQDVSLRVGARDRVALVGANGAGKTTLLEIIAGRDSADTGGVSFAKDAVVGYLEQEAIEMAGRTVLEEALTAAEHVTSLEHRLRVLEDEIALSAEDEHDRLLAEYGRLQSRFESLGGYTVEAEARAVLGGLGFREKDLTRDAGEFSGGWLMRLALAKLLLRRPDVLLLDEPTNHLDLESVNWLESFLRTYEGAIVIVSHDRAFMDGLVDRVAEIENKRLTQYPGNYTAYEKAREIRLEQLKTQREAQEKEIAHMQVFVDRFRYKNTKAKAAQDRMRRIEKIKAELVEIPEARKQVRFRFPQPERVALGVLDGVAQGPAGMDDVRVAGEGVAVLLGIEGRARLQQLGGKALRAFRLFEPERIRKDGLHPAGGHPHHLGQGARKRPVQARPLDPGLPPPGDPPKDQGEGLLVLAHDEETRPEVQQGEDDCDGPQHPESRPQRGLQGRLALARILHGVVPPAAVPVPGPAPAPCRSNGSVSVLRYTVVLLLSDCSSTSSLRRNKARSGCSSNAL